MHSKDYDKYNLDIDNDSGNEEYQSWNKFKKILINYLEKQKFIIKKDYIKFAIEEFNKFEYNFNFDLTRINNFFYHWKSNSIKFTKYYLLENPKTFDNRDYLKLYKKKVFIVTKKKFLDLEFFIYITDFFANKIKISKNIFLDGNFKKPENFFQIIIIQFFHSNINKKYTGGYLITNSKTYEGYVDILTELKSIIYKGESKTYFESITIDLEVGLYKSCKLVFSNSIIIGCDYHYKFSLVRYIKKLRLYKDSNKKNIKELISILGLLPINYDGDIDYLNRIILNLQTDNRFTKLKIFFDYFRKEWIPNFENNMLHYKLIPKQCRANTSLENYKFRL